MSPYPTVANVVKAQYIDATYCNSLGASAAGRRDRGGVTSERQAGPSLARLLAPAGPGGAQPPRPREKRAFQVPGLDPVLPELAALAHALLPGHEPLVV